MSEEFIQKKIFENTPKIGKWDFFNIGNTTLQDLKKYDIIRNVDYKPYEKKKVDGLVVLNKTVIAVVEYKTPKQFKSQKQKNKAIEQELEVANILDSKVFVVTDGENTVWINPKTGNNIRNEDNSILTYKFDYNDPDLATLLQKIASSINEQNDNLIPIKLINPTDLAQSIWQDVWSVSGATPENCLYTFVELFIFKYLSDLDILKNMRSFSYLMNLYAQKETDDNVLEYYVNTIRPYIKSIFEPGKDGTTIINGTIFVSKDEKAVAGYSTVFHKVLTKFDIYGKLEHIDYDFKSKLFESFLKESISKKNWGQYFTPLCVVRAIVEMADNYIKPGVSICDPACGVGKFLLEPVLKKINNFYEIAPSGVINPKITLKGFDKGFDKDEQKTIILAKANMVIYFSNLMKDNPLVAQHLSQLLNDTFVLKTNSILGTLSDAINNEYDLILTNPPYVTSGSSNLKDEINKNASLQDHYKINGMGVEGLFMEWIVRALKPGGHAFIVVPDGILNRQNDVELRRFIRNQCYITGVISLPLKTFFTTQKKTYILCITKKVEESEIQTNPVFTYFVSEIGESRDVYRFEIEQNDLYDAVKLYKGFIGSMEYFIENNNNPRCKIQPITMFEPEKHWSVDRWWSHEERVQLGIEDELDSMSIQDFGNSVKEMAESLDEISQSMNEFETKNNDSKYHSISLNDKRFFELSIGKRVVKRDFHLMKGDYPIYSANVFDPIGYHVSSNISDFANNFVLWGIDGCFEFNYLKKGTKFRYTDHCGVIRIINDDILPEYLMIQLDLAKKKYGFDRGLRSSLKNMRIIEIPIPYTTEGKIDIENQKQVIHKYNLVKELKNKFQEFQKIIDKTNISMN